MGNAATATAFRQIVSGLVLPFALSCWRCIQKAVALRAWTRQKIGENLPPLSAMPKLNFAIGWPQTMGRKPMRAILKTASGYSLQKRIGLFRRDRYVLA